MLSETSVEIARKAIPFMSEKGIPLTPRNYHIWYEYFRGIMPDLCETIDSLLESGEPFSDKAAEKIYKRFFVRDNGAEREQKMIKEMMAVDEANAKVTKILEPTARDLMGLSETNASYGKRLNGIAGEISGIEVENLGDFIMSLAEDTKKIAAQNHLISDELKSSSLKLDELRNRLTSARAEARLDDLTKIANRRAFNERLAAEIERVEEENSVSGLALVDIDLFKRINDQYGHPVGDKALQTIARQIAEATGNSDEVFRYGGEEFAIIMSGVDLDEAMNRVEKVRGYINDQEFVIRDHTEEITISAGVARIKSGRTSEVLQEITDEALYLAKNSGRNNVKSEQDLRAEDVKGA